MHLLDSQNLKSFWQLIFPFAGNCCLAGRKKSRSNNQLRTKPVTVDSMQNESVVFSWNKASLSSLHFERNNFYSYIFTFEYSAAHPVVIYSLLLSMSGAVDIRRLELYWCSVLISNFVRQYWHKTISFKSNHKVCSDLNWKAWSRYILQQDKPQLETLIHISLKLSTDFGTCWPSP